MEDLIENSVIKGLLFSAFDKFGPQPIYMFPKEVSEEEAEQSKLQNIVKLSYRDYTQISIKNLSMMAGDQEYIELREESKNAPYFAILPFPDFNLTSLTIFHFIKFKTSKEPVASSFSILVDRNRRSFLYNNLNQLKSLVFNFLLKFDKEISDGYKSPEMLEPIFKDLLLKLIEVEKKPYAPITHATRIKVIFSGLDDSGKTSFLLSVDRKYSKLIGLKPTVGANVSSIQALGASIFLWDLGGQIASRQKYLTKSQIYLYETDLLFYFIDIKNKARFEESIEYFQKIITALKEFKMDTPIIFIFSKGDKDILNTQEIKENIKYLKSKLIEISSNKKPEIYITSIFSIFSILQAFSSGISKLSPNRKLINLILQKFSKRAEVSLSLLLNNEGLVLADFFSSEAFKSSMLKQADEGSDEDKIRNIFEVTAPQFTMLYKIFSEFRALKQDEAIFKIADSVILFKKIRIADYDFFVLFLMDEEIKKNRINELMPDFMYRTGDLLLRYIS